MDFMQAQLDQEAVDSANRQINYYSNLPKHIKGRVSELHYPNTSKQNNDSTDGFGIPAHVVNGTITVISGKLNMPNFN